MQEMDGVEYLYHYQSTTTDCWTSRQTKGYMTVTLHIINAPWQLRSRVLSTSTTLVEGSELQTTLKISPLVCKKCSRLGVSVRKSRP